MGLTNNVHEPFNAGIYSVMIRLSIALTTLRMSSVRGCSPAFAGGIRIFDTIPLTVGEIRWIHLVVVHIPSVSPLSPLSKQALRYSFWVQNFTSCYFTAVGKNIDP